MTTARPLTHITNPTMGFDKSHHPPKSLKLFSNNYNTDETTNEPTNEPTNEQHDRSTNEDLYRATNEELVQKIREIYK